MKKTAALPNVRPLTRNALRHDVVVHLMSAIFQGDLPVGSRLIIRRLAEQLGISATPIREALVELEAIGVVQFIHNRGAMAKPFGQQELRDIFHVRRLLEVEASRCACGLVDRGELTSLLNNTRELLDAEESSNWLNLALAADQRLHELIAHNCGNLRLAAEINRYNILMQAIREIVGNRQHVQRLGLEEHISIIEALLKGDREKAAKEMAHHIDRAMESIDVVLFKDKK